MLHELVAVEAARQALDYSPVVCIDASNSQKNLNLNPRKVNAR